MCLKISFILCACIFIIFAQEKNYRRIEQQTAVDNFSTDNIFPINKFNTGSGVWTEVNPLVPRVDYLGIHFVDENNGWAVGADGAIIYSTNGGNKWQSTNSPTTNVLLNVHSFNGQNIVATGYNGTIVRSTDKGINWQLVSSGVGGDLWEIKMVNDTLGWVCGTGPSLLRTTNAGETWNIISTGYNSFNYWALDYMDKDILYVAGNDGNILKTTNGGSDWQLLQTGFGKSLYRIVVFDTLRIVSGGEMGWVAYTFDGGITWNHSTAGGEIDAMAFTNGTVGYIAGYQSENLYKTTNGGISWQWQDADDIGAYWLMFVNDSIGFNAGLDLVIKKTTDGGQYWNPVIFKDDLVDVWFISENLGWVLSSRKVTKTTNGGIAWQSFIFDPLLLGYGLETIFFVDSLTGFVGGANKRIFKTTDGGITWQRKNVYGIVDSTYSINDIFFINNSIGWAGSSDLLKTTDGGESWNPLTNSTWSTVVQFLDTLNGFTLGGGYLNKTTDGGYTWELINLPVVEVGDIYFHTPSVGWYIANDELYYTENSGSTWDQRLTDPDIFYGKFNWIKPEEAFITGLKTYYTADSGNTWTDVSGEVGFDIKRMHSGNGYSGYAIGNLGLIVQYIDTSIIPVELTSFRAEQIGNDVQLSWSSASELNNAGYIIERKNEHSSFEKIGFVEGKGTSTEHNYYSFRDKLLQAGKYFYRLKQIDYNGTYDYSKIIELEIAAPTKFSLEQNYPNPFNPSTRISFSLSTDSKVTLKIFDMLGKEITTVIDKDMSAGYYNITFNASELTSGIYFYRITSGNYTATKKLILLK